MKTLKKKYFIAFICIVVGTIILVPSTDHPHNQEGRPFALPRLSFENFSNSSQLQVPTSTTSKETTDLHFIKCQKLKALYENLEQLNEQKKLTLRFENIHKKIEQRIYRLRHFYKDGDEGEIPSFLVYLEENEDSAKIIEKSRYKKGSLFIKIEKAEGEILYKEEGYTPKDNDDLLLHFKGNALVATLGPDTDCRF